MTINSIKYKFNIYIIEPSDIVFEGISNILLKYANHVIIYRLENLDELELINNNSHLNIILINPSCCLGNLKNFQNLKKNFPGFFWVAIVYNIFKVDLVNQFDFVINIFDSIEKIVFSLNQLLGNSPNQETEEENQLTDREVEVLKEIVKGLSNKDISEKLNISIHTVVSHTKNISKKTGIKSRSALAIYALTNKMFSLEEL